MCQLPSYSTDTTLSTNAPLNMSTFLESKDKQGHDDDQDEPVD